MLEANAMIHPIDIDADINIDERSALWRKLAQWWRTWRDLHCCVADKVEGAASDGGANEPKSSILAGKWPVAGDLLGRKMANLKLGVIDTAPAGPCAMQELQTLRQSERPAAKAGRTVQ